MSPVSQIFLPAHAVAHQVVFSTMTMTVALARSELDLRKEEHFEIEKMQPLKLPK